ncbi:hypothetical protein, partial [Priestia megaterium]|uniref:hypothetical protein n=1 Tax=Priestia megaterium TaxID=1404 RepID=UPI002FFDF9C3
HSKAQRLLITFTTALVKNDWSYTLIKVLSKCQTKDYTYDQKGTFFVGKICSLLIRIYLP